MSKGWRTEIVTKEISDLGALSPVSTTYLKQSKMLHTDIILEYPRVIGKTYE